MRFLDLGALPNGLPGSAGRERKRRKGKCLKYRITVDRSRSGKMPAMAPSASPGSPCRQQ